MLRMFAPLRSRISAKTSSSSLLSSSSFSKVTFTTICNGSSSSWKQPKHVTTTTVPILSSSRLSMSSLAQNNISSSSSSSSNNDHEREIVTYVTLNNISDNPGAIKKKRRVGRGIGSSKGKTCGRGHKGQKARGSVKPGFEGGQTKFYKRLPKRGFRNTPHEQPMTPVNVGTLQDFVDMGRLPHRGSAQRPLTMHDLVTAGVTTRSSIKHGVKLLGKGQERVRDAIRIDVSRASRSAVRAVEAAGGEITTVHYNRLALKALLKPHKFDILPKRALPPPRLMGYYNDYEKRGYLSPEMQRKKVLRRIEQENETKEKKNDS